jgi:hypothetical protein
MHSGPNAGPATFQERGVAVPFTTPSLLGTRLRHTARGLELVVPHPARARGVYVMACNDLRHFGAATMHDLAIAERLIALKEITPRSVRAAGLAVAAQGAAGRPARAAALAAIQSNRDDGAAAVNTLVQRLVRQANNAPSRAPNGATIGAPNTAPCRPAALDPPNALEQKAKHVLLRLADQLGKPAAALTLDLEALAGSAAGVVLGRAEPSRCASRLADLGALIDSLREQAAGLPGRSGQAARFVIASGMASQTAIRRHLAELTVRLDDATSCLAEWSSAPAHLAAALMVPEWLLDGWSYTGLIWQESGLATPRGALDEMALQVPLLPREAGEPLATEPRPLLTGAEDWRGGATVYDLVARNERILAYAA